MQVTNTLRRLISWSHKPFGQTCMEPIFPIPGCSTEACLHTLHPHQVHVYHTNQQGQQGNWYVLELGTRYSIFFYKHWIVVEVFFMYNLTVSERHVVTRLMHSDGHMQSWWLWIYKHRSWKRCWGLRWMISQWSLGQSMRSWTCWMHIRLNLIVAATVMDRLYKCVPSSFIEGLRISKSTSTTRKVQMIKPNHLLPAKYLSKWAI